MRTLRLALGLLLAAAPLAAQRRSAAPAPASAEAWPLAIGTSAGFVDVHTIGGPADVTALMFPSWGSALVGFGLPVSTIPSLYMTIPMGAKLAIEPSLDITRTQTNGPDTRFGSTLGGRLDYAFSRGFYGAAGLNFLIVKATGIKTFAIPGLGVAGGYRFHLGGAWGGRIEISHTMMAKHKTTNQRPVTISALSVGASVALR